MKLHTMLSDNWLTQYSDHKINATHALGKSDQVMSFSNGTIQPHTFSNWFLLQVESGVLQLELDDNVLLVLEPGDCWLAQPHRPLSWRQEGPVSVDVWQHESASKSVLLDIVQGFYDVTVHILNSLRRPIVDPLANFKSYQDGEVIVQEGDKADCVFLLMQGKANVIKNNQKIGSINRDEIIGLQGMLMQQVRTASVIADGPCCAAQVNYENFMQLIEAKPGLVMASLETMANHLNRTTQRLTDETETNLVVGF